MRSTISHIALATEFNLRTLASDPDDSMPTEAELATVDDVAQLLERAYHRFEELRPTLTPERLNTLLMLRAIDRIFTLPRWAILPHCQSLDLPPRSGRLQPPRRRLQGTFIWERAVKMPGHVGRIQE